MSSNNETNKKPLWEIINSKPVFDGKWISMRLDEIKLPDGKLINFEGVHYHFEGAGVCAKDKEGKIVLVQNYRYLTNLYSWEIPAGVIDPGYEPADVIIKELKEEAGCEVKKENTKKLGVVHPSIGSSNQLLHCFSAINVEQVSDELDTNEITNRKWFTKEEIGEMIRSGEIKDQFSISVLLWDLFLT